MRNQASFGPIIQHDVLEHRKMTNHSSGPWGPPSIWADIGVTRPHAENTHWECSP